MIDCIVRIVGLFTVLVADPNLGKVVLLLWMVTLIKLDEARSLSRDSNLLNGVAHGVLSEVDSFANHIFIVLDFA